MMILAMELASAAAAAPHLPEGWVMSAAKSTCAILPRLRSGEPSSPPPSLEVSAAACCSRSRRMTAYARWGGNSPSRRDQPRGLRQASRRRVSGRGCVMLVAASSCAKFRLADLQRKFDRPRAARRVTAQCWNECRTRRRKPLLCAPAERSWLGMSRQRSTRWLGKSRPGRRHHRSGFWRRFAELARGFATSALAHKSLVKLAVVVDPGQMDGATLNSFEASPVGIRQFAHSDKKAALEWAAAARRGE